MSWQEYVDTHLVGSGKVTKAAIIGKQGGVWATSSGFTISPEEQKRCAEIINNPDTFAISGVTLNGVKYMGLRIEEFNGVSTFLGRKGATPAGSGIILSRYEAPITPQDCAPVTANIAKHIGG